MNVLYCGDENIKNGLLISVLSLLKNVNEELCIYVLTIDTKINDIHIKGISEIFIKEIDNILKRKNANSFAKLIDITQLFNDEFPSENIETRFTPCCMLRLYADKIDILPNRIMYLDNDVICRKNPLEFYNQNIDDIEIVGVLDYYGKWFFKNNLLKFDYINSGVLLMNLSKIRETHSFKECRNMCQKKNMFMPDQSAINKVVKNKKIVSRKYNDQRKLHQDTVFQHFTTSFRFFPIFHPVTIKPWEISRVHNELNIFEYDDIFKEYQKEVEKMSMSLL